MPRDSAAADRPASYLVGTAAAFLLFFRDRTKPINQLPFSPSAKFPKSGSSCESRARVGRRPLAPVGVLFGFAAFLIATGLFYGLPLPVQPMKAVSAVILTDGLRSGEVAAAGLMLGLVLLVLGITGWIRRLARMIPQSVHAGLQL